MLKSALYVEHLIDSSEFPSDAAGDGPTGAAEHVELQKVDHAAEPPLKRRRVEGDPFEALPEPLVARIASYVHYDKALGPRLGRFGVPEEHLATLNKRFRAVCEAHAAEIRSSKASHALEVVAVETLLVPVYS